MARYPKSMSALPAAFLALLLSAISSHAAGSSVTASDPFSGVKTRIHASNEEWSVILPRLEEILRLRNEVNAVVLSAPAPKTLPMMGMLNSPLGGTSLDTPTTPAGMKGTPPGSRGAGSRPFDPKTTPGHSNPQRSVLMTLLGADSAAMRRSMARLLATDQGNSVEALLSELHALLAAEGTTDAQLREKLASIRAARARAARDLQRVQEELKPLLTFDQFAMLVSLGHIE